MAALHAGLCPQTGLATPATCRGDTLGTRWPGGGRGCCLHADKGLAVPGRGVCASGRVSHHPGAGDGAGT